jgi:hypothetical protein
MCAIVGVQRLYAPRTRCRRWPFFDLDDAQVLLQRFRGVCGGARPNKKTVIYCSRASRQRHRSRARLPAKARPTLPSEGTTDAADRVMGDRPIRTQSFTDGDEAQQRLTECGRSRNASSAGGITRKRDYNLQSAAKEPRGLHSLFIAFETSNLGQVAHEGIGRSDYEGEGCFVMPDTKTCHELAVDDRS